MREGVFAVKRLSDGMYRHKDYKSYTRDVEEVLFFDRRSAADYYCDHLAERIIQFKGRGE